MSHLLARIMLALLMLPLAVVVYVLAIYTWYEVIAPGVTFGDVPALLFASAVTWGFVMAYWVVLWRGTVRWTRRRVVGTLLTTAGALLAGVGCGALLEAPDDSFRVFMSGVVTVLSWLTASVFLWRETAAERAERIRARAPDAVVCPTCGYNLTGLRQTTCPECGRRYTVDELLSLQPGRSEEADGLT